MTGLLASRTGPSVEVRCGSCGDVFELSLRREYAYRKANRVPVCHFCRRPEREAPEPEYYLYWTSRFTYTELLELATAWRRG